jgi:hypothetical protein
MLQASQGRLRYALGLVRTRHTAYFDADFERIKALLDERNDDGEASADA